MNFKGAIFDFDGTLIDSMKIWDSIGAAFLISRGITPPDHIESILRSMSFFQSTAYFIKEYNLSDTQQQIKDQMYQIIADQYKYTMPLKEGVLEYLEYLSQKGIKMCIATATDKELAIHALRRLGIDHYFSFIKTCDEVGKGKDDPEIYLQAASRLGIDKNDIYIFEDVLYCVKTAKKAGFKVVGIYDESSKEDAEALRELCDRYVMSFKELYCEEERF